jgi:hypothetical protein
MTIVNGYCTLVEVKASVTIDTSDVVDDVALEKCIEGASRNIDRYCRRRFFVNSVDETRYYTPTNPNLVLIDDLVSITTLKTDDAGTRAYSTTWATTDYDLFPVNAALDGWPYQSIQTTPNGSYRFYPRYPKSVQVVGKFGFSAVPADVHQACMIQAARYFKRKDVVFGIAGVGGMGQLRALDQLDPDVQQLLAPPLRRFRNG